MTDARLAPTFLLNQKIDVLEDDDFRVYVNSIVFAASHETDGFVGTRSLRNLHPTADVKACAEHLVVHGLWEPVADGWLIHDFLEYQSPKSQLEGVREANRRRKAKEREGKASTSHRDPANGHAVTDPEVTDDAEDVTPRHDHSHAVTGSGSTADVTPGQDPWSRRDIGSVTPADKGQDRTGKDRQLGGADVGDFEAAAPGAVLCEVCGRPLGASLVSRGQSAHQGCLSGANSVAQHVREGAR